MPREWQPEKEEIILGGVPRHADFPLPESFDPTDLPEAAPSPAASPYNASQNAGLRVRQPTWQIEGGVQTEPGPQDYRVPAATVTGHYDAWAGKVLAAHDAAADKVLGQTRAVTVQRVSVRWGTNNAVLTGEAPPPMSQLCPSIAVALPLPPRQDQPGYMAAVGDVVTVLTGRDGLCYYLPDDVPFIGVVIKSTVSVKEDTAGGAGLLWLSVRRQAMTADPSEAVATLGNCLTAAGATIDYSYVLVLAPVGQQHGYRVGDRVWVHRRGLYYFALPARQWFLAKTGTVGPDSEAAPTDNSYWVREQTPTVAYTNSTYTVTYADKTQTDPTASGGRYGRWVLAWNLGEESWSHLVPTGTVVMVQIGNDVEGDPTYHFTALAVGRQVRFGKPTEAYTTGATFILAPCDSAGTGTGEANVTVQAGWTLPTVTGTALTIPTTAIIPFVQAANGNYYVLGQPVQAWGPVTYNSGTKKLQQTTWYEFGLFRSTISDAQDITTATAFVCP